MRELGAITIFAGQIFRTLLNTHGNLRPILQQISYVSFRALSTVAFSGIFVGAILVLQFNLMLSEYDATSLLGGLNTSTIIREVGPLIISFLLAGKIGAFTAAELGTMRVTDQIDAIKCLGADPIQSLVLPRFIAIIISNVILLIIGMMISVVGAILIAQIFCGVNPLQFIGSIPKFTDSWTFFCGITKCEVYALIIASVACYKGYTASGGARGVGRAVTSAAVYTNFYIVIANTLTSYVLEALNTIRLMFVEVMLG